MGAKTEVLGGLKTSEDGTSRISEPMASKIISSHIFDLAQQFVRSEACKCVSTGIPLLDRALEGGLVAGSIYTLSGRPGTGKTSLALSIARRMAFDGGKRVVFLSLEMTALELVERMVCQTTRIPSKRLKLLRDAGQLAELMKPFLHTAELSKLKIEDQHKATPADLTMLLEEVADNERPELLIIDHLQHQLFAEGLSRAEAMANYMADLKDLAKHHQVIMLVCSQLNRAAEGEKRPKASHLKSSGAIEEVSDCVLVCTKGSLEEGKVRLDAQSEPTEFTVSIVKHRRGPVNEITLMFQPEIYEFDEPGSDWTPKRPRIHEEQETISAGV